MPVDRRATYERIIVIVLPHKTKEPNRTRLTIGDNLIDYALVIAVLRLQISQL